MKTGRAVWTVFAWLAAGACSDSGAGMPVGVGPAGGSVVAHGTKLEISAGALVSEVTLTVEPAPDAPEVAGATSVGTPVTLGPEGQTFAVPVTVTLSYDPSRLPAGKTPADVVIYTAPAGSSAYTALTTRVVDSTHVAADTSHLSTFVPAVVTLPPAWTDVSPNPRPSPASRFAAVTMGGSGAAVVVVAGGAGTVWTSANGGTTWESAQVASESAQLASVAATETEIWVAPVAAYVYRAPASLPLAFERRPPLGEGTPPSEAVTGLVVTPTGVVHACGGSALMKSVDGGMTFEGVGGDGPTLRGIAVRESTMNIVGVGRGSIGGQPSGGITQSFFDTGAGSTVLLSSGTGMRPFNAVWVVPTSGPAFAAGEGGVINRLGLGNPSSTMQAHLAGGTLRAIAGSGSTIIAVGDGGLIVRSTNGGASFAADPSGTTVDLYGVVIASGGEAYAVGDDGTILKRMP